MDRQSAVQKARDLVAQMTVEEAASYSGIGIGKIKEISNNDRCPFVLWVGTKRLIKRRQFDAYIDKMFSI